MEQYFLFSVEAQDDRDNWKAIDMFSGTKGSEAETKAYALRDTWISKGWPANKIVVREAKFASRNKNVFNG